MSHGKQADKTHGNSTGMLTVLAYLLIIQLTVTPKF